MGVGVEMPLVEVLLVVVVVGLLVAPGMPTQ
jgi:hypothetical protein